MIDDAELRELFQSESEEHLQSLEEGLLRLETAPDDGATLEEVFRAAHSLKGTARMLGVAGVETLSHHMEDELGNARRGRAALTPPVIDRMVAGLDAIRKLVDEAVSGAPANVDINHALSQLNGTAPLDNSRAVQNDAPIEIIPDNAASGNVETPALISTAFAIEPQAIEPLVFNEIEAAPSSNGIVVLPPQIEPPIANVEMPSAPAMSGPVPYMSTHVEALTSTAPFSQALVLADDSSVVVAPLVEAAPVELATVGEVAAELVEDKSEIATEAGTEVASAKGDFKIQTMRVPPARLDALLTLASELNVTATRVSRGLAAFVEMSGLWEEWNKDLASQRPLLESSTHTTDAKRWHEFHGREVERLARLQDLWERVRQTALEDVTRLSLVADELEEGIRNVRLLPLATIFNLFPRAVRDLARDQNKELQLVIEGGDTTADKRILEELKDPLMHMVRNAVDHGIEPPSERQSKGKPRMATIRLRARQTATNVIVELQDDGRGLDIEAIKRTAMKRRLYSEEELGAMTKEQIQLLIFSPGFSTSPLVTDVSGRGVGMDVVRINVEKLKGRIEVDSEPGRGTLFSIRLPLTLATSRVLLIEAENNPYALPIEFVQGIVRVQASQFFKIEGRETFMLDDEAIPIARLSHLLELPVQAGKKTSPDEALVCVVVSDGAAKIGLLVDELLDEQEVVLKPLGPMLKRVRNVSGATILGAGEVCMVLNPHDLIKSAQRNRPAAVAALPESESEQRRKVILLAEDSITTRTQEKRILESAGYEVVTAVDGADAFAKLPTRDFDAVISDVEMPNMTGLQFAARVRENSKYKELPFILVTSLATEDDKRRGAEAGANAYLTKGTFEQKVLLDTLRRLV